MNEAKISIIVPVFNGEKHLIKCMDSIINQTFKDIEIIIVNDGSSDGTLEIAQEYCLNYKNTRVVTKENAGLPQARKTGFEHSKGEYLMFVDVDDWIEPNMVERLYDTIVRTSADIVSCNCVLEDAKGKYLSKEGIEEEKEYDSEQAIKEILNRTSVFPYMWNKIFRRNIVNRAVFPTGHFIGEDYCTLLAILDVSKKIVHIPEVLYHYIQHDNNMTKAGFGTSYSLAYENYDIRKKYLLEKYPQLKSSIISFHLLEEMAILNAMLRNNKFDEEMRRKIVKYVRKNIWNYLFQSRSKVIHKGAAITISINWKLYRKVYLKLCQI